MVGASTGGGNILVTEIDHMKVSFTAQNTTLLALHWDRPGTVAAVSNYMAKEHINIATFQLSRSKKGGKAMMTLEVDGEIPEDIVDRLRQFKNFIRITLVKVG